MRVLETVPSISYKMGKNKKHRIRKSKENAIEDSSDDALLQGCTHISKAVNMAAMRKAVLKTGVILGECTGCSKDPSKATSRDLFGGLVEGPAAAAEGDDVELLELSVCICLQCGHQGCDRHSANKHALKHYKTPHSGIHCIIVNLSNWSTWCYACDEEVTSSPRIQGCVDFLQKQMGISKPEPMQAQGGKSPDSPGAEADPPVFNSPTSKNAMSCVKVKGLSNLGNTCFFNAVMQNMCQTRGLESLLVDWGKQGKVCTISVPEVSPDSDISSSEDEREEDLTNPKTMPNIQTTYNEPGPITIALLNFLQEMKGGTTKNGTINPNILFTQVCKKAPRFKGFQQQDSHELLRYLIDCIRTEEIKRGQLSILKHFKLPETVNPKKVDEDTKMKIKEYGRQVKHTFLDSLFGGELVSTVKCEECKNVSQIYEAFLDLSLPVTEEKPLRPNLVLIGKKKDAVILGADHSHHQADSQTVTTTVDSWGDNGKPSKYQERKNKRLAKKESKRTSRLHRLTGQDSVEAKTEDGGEEEKPPTPDEEHVSEESAKNDDCGDLRGSEESALATSTPMKNGNVSQLEQGLQRLSLYAGGDACTPPAVRETVQEAVSGETTQGSSRLESSPEGSKEGLDNDDERDDPSDADIEDNLESDMSRLDLCDKAKTCSIAHAPNPTDLSCCKKSVQYGVDLKPTAITNGYDDIVNNNVDLSNTLSDKCSVQTKDGSMFVKSEDNPESNCLPNNTPAKDETTMDLSQVSVEVTVNNHAVNEAAGDSAEPPISASAKKEVADDRTEVSATFNLTLAPAVETTGPKGDNPAVVPEGGVVCPSQGVEQHQQNILKTQQEYLKEAKNHSMNTLAPRYHPASKECSILSCLNQFTAAELLTGSNKVSCKDCTKLKRNTSLPQKDKKTKEKVCSNASKQYLIFRPPAILTLHLKRFEQTGLTSRKVNRHVDFPLLLDLAPYCSSLCSNVKAGQGRVLYSLYGVVEHSGRLSAGHYTAYIKVRPGLGTHTQFLHSQAPRQLDLLNTYMERVFKQNQEASAGSPQDNDPSSDSTQPEALVPPGRWFHISDSRVNEVTEMEVLKAQAYLLFYERVL